MKGTIIGTDLLEFNNSVKILEINTNTTIFNSAVDLLDYTSFFQMLINNNITELHFIYNEREAYIADTSIEGVFLFEERLKTKCIENSITYFNYTVPKNSVTVPYVEDADNKFILRQAYDTTALVDETYCADKFEFFNLMKNSQYIPKTYKFPVVSNAICTGNSEPVPPMITRDAGHKRFVEDGDLWEEV